jgi:ADP-L-glycero-D-manno-heptose 6-epimerase
LKSTKALVTGHLGFIGSRLRVSLEQLGIQTLGLEKDALLSEDWESEIATFLDLEQPTAIFHVGACADTLEKNVQSIMVENFESTKTLFDWAKSKRVPFVYSSSAANYGTNGRFPSNLYGWSKYVAEQYVISKGGVALRYFNVYGPGEDHKGNMASFVLQAHQKVLSGSAIQLFPGRPRRDFVFIDDVIQANVYALQNYDTLGGRFYEVGSGDARHFEDMLDILEIPYTYADESAIPEGYQFFTQSTMENWMPGWRPEHSIETGLGLYSRYLGKQ